ncbi:MAG: cold shock domain-containing protein [Planctomycetes bacterium]|nr:cold shock domain-containing protein [Planctomycetota bacterium]
MPIGRVKWYDKTKGYGFIESPEGDVFFHFSDIQMEGFKALAEDQRVSYKLMRTPEGLKAKSILPLDQRATVRRAARYRNLTCMKIKEGCEAQFEKFINDIPAWYDEMQQDLGMRRIGTWRAGLDAIHLAESDRPYDQTMQLAKENLKWGNYQKWLEELRKLLDADPKLMSPVLPAEEPPAAQ